MPETQKLTGNSKNSSEPAGGIPETNGDVKPWWKLWYRNQEWRDNLHRKMVHKSLDIPDDEMGDIKVDNSRRGLGVKELLGIAAIAAIPTAGWIYTAMNATPAVKEVIERVAPGETKTIERDKRVDVEYFPPEQ